MNNEVQKKVDASAYLSSLQQRYPELNIDVAEQALTLMQQVLNRLTAIDPASEFDQIEQQFITLKAEFAFLWSLAELCGQGSFEQRGALQTQFAELTIDIALQVAWHAVAVKQKPLQGLLAEKGTPVNGLFIFGMGKLGGGDLNFSSDVDLVAYFDPDVLPVPDTLGKSYICHQVLQKLTMLLSQNGRSDFIWRVDWRLRPNASATTLAMSTVAAQDYYFFRASPWHRLALMKARVIAGDKSTGQVFLNAITPFIWRQNLDYRALDELAEIKHKINLEHPSLRAERQWREPINDDISGFNVKLGTGGIREIEFIANALQLIWGGKHYSLRTANTLYALDALQQLGHFDSELAAQLQIAYEFLRKVENAIQIMGNQQSHSVPRQLENQQRFCVLLGIAGWSAFVELLNQHRLIVSEYFEEIFADQEVAEAPKIEWPENLTTAAQQIIAIWDRGFYQYGVSNQIHQRLLPLAKALADYLQNAEQSGPGTFDSSATVLRLHEFFRSLPQGEQYFRLLAESPRLLDSIIPPLLYSPAMSILLKQSPHIVDCYMGQQFSPDDAFDSDFVVQADNYEVRLERMRRFVNEHLYQLYLLFMQGQLSVERFQHLLSDLAEHTLELALTVVADYMDLAESPISVVGMGKMGMGRMSPLSDLDLIFVFDPANVSLEVATRFVARLQTAIATPMREGIVYELDTRLRPSGRSGAPTLSLDSFAAHQMQRAHTWEHIALVPSRVVAGDRSLQNRIDQIKRQVLTTPRDSQQLFKDALKMWKRIAEHRVQEKDASLMFSKLRPGGLMQTEYLAACLILSHGQAGDSVEFDLLLQAVVEAQPIFAELPKVLQFWRTQQLWERLLGFTELSVVELPPHYLKFLLQQSEVASIDELIAKKHQYAQQVIIATDRLFAQIDDADFDVDEWLEKRVEWRT